MTKLPSWFSNLIPYVLEVRNASRDFWNCSKKKRFKPFFICDIINLIMHLLLWHIRYFEGYIF